jgi:hypothetical protein
MNPNNLFSGIPSNLSEELFTPLQQMKGLRIERIVSQGHVSPSGFRYDQDEHQWVIVLSAKPACEFRTSPSSGLLKSEARSSMAASIAGNTSSGNTMFTTRFRNPLRALLDEPADNVCICAHIEGQPLDW